MYYKCYPWETGLVFFTDPFLHLAISIMGNVCLLNLQTHSPNVSTTLKVISLSQMLFQILTQQSELTSSFSSLLKNSNTNFSNLFTDNSCQITQSWPMSAEEFLRKLFFFDQISRYNGHSPLLLIFPLDADMMP